MFLSNDNNNTNCDLFVKALGMLRQNWKFWFFTWITCIAPYGFCWTYRIGASRDGTLYDWGDAAGGGCGPLLYDCGVSTGLQINQQQQRNNTISNWNRIEWNAYFKLNLS